MNEKPGCRICGNQHYHVPLCSYGSDWFSEPTPVLDSERKDFGRMAQATAESLGRGVNDPNQINQARSNHFTNESIDRSSFPDHISRDGKAFYRKPSEDIQLAKVPTKNKLTTDSAPEGCTLVAHDTGEGWALAVENYDGDVVAYLKWSDSWPEMLTAAQLREKGFLIV